MKKYIVSLVCLCSFVMAESIQLGDAVTTAFSGVQPPSPSEKFPQKIKTPGKSYLSTYNDELFIDVNGTSVVVRALKTDKDNLWNAAVLHDDTRFKVPASQIGQVFGIALDDAKTPNIYVTATSMYGLYLVKPDLPYELRYEGMEDEDAFVTNDKDTRPERMVLGGKYARWMDGLFGKGGGPGTVWKIDGRNGKVSKFTDIKLKGVSNSGAALGNIAYDPAHKQFFVSDLDTGMIHRISRKGKDLGYLDHGLHVRKLLGLKPIIYNAHDRIDKHSQNFDTTNTQTWGYTRAGRMVYGLTVAFNRLFYSVYNGKKKPTQIWSIGLNKKGNFSKDARFELEVEKVATNLPISDMIVTRDGEMILAQRVLNRASYTMSMFIGYTPAQVLRYHLKVPYDGKLNRWYPIPQEYAVGFEEPYQNGMGGIALGYNYDTNGTIEKKLCDKSIWISGENLKKNKEYASIFLKDGMGIQGTPRTLSNVNKPGWQSLFSLYPKSKYESKGAMGDVEIYRHPCICKCKEKGYGKIIETSSKGIVPSPLTSSLDTPFPEVGTPSLDCFGLPWWMCVPVVVNCWTMPSLPFCKDKEKVPPKKDPEKECMVVETSPPGPFLQSDGTSWQLPLYGISSRNGMNIDSMKITPVSGVASVTNGPVFSVGTPLPLITGVIPGTDAILNLCGFDSTKVVPGQPYECCNVKVKFKIREWESDEDNQTLEVVR